MRHGSALLCVGLGLVALEAASLAAPVDGKAFTDATNAVRAKHCAPPIKWSQKLAASAQRWAETIKKRGCALQHSGGAYGENLAAGTQGTLDPGAVVAMWYREIMSYSFSHGSFSPKTGHFTQLVWKATTELGCGRVACGEMDVFVCQFDPPGNVEGEYKENVKQAGCR
jgi:uncharacterized protein YkwD